MLGFKSFHLPIGNRNVLSSGCEVLNSLTLENITPTIYLNWPKYTKFIHEQSFWPCGLAAWKHGFQSHLIISYIWPTLTEKDMILRKTIIEIIHQSRILVSVESWLILFFIKNDCNILIKSTVDLWSKSPDNVIILTNYYSRQSVMLRIT